LCIFAPDFNSEINEALCFLVLENVGNFQAEYQGCITASRVHAWAVLHLIFGFFLRPSSTMWDIQAHASFVYLSSRAGWQNTEEPTGEMAVYYERKQFIFLGRSTCYPLLDIWHSCFNFHNRLLYWIL